MQPGPDPYGQQPPDPTSPPPPSDPYAPSYGSAPGQPYDPYPPPPGTNAAPPGPPYPASAPPGPPTSYRDQYGGTPMYPNAGYPFPQGQQNTLGLLAMILGIASVPLACCHLGLPLGIAAVVTGWLGKQKADQGLAGNGGQALAGVVCGAIGAVLGLGWAVLTLADISAGG